jgi:rSAM/selenodomain-associated transferase 1
VETTEKLIIFTRYPEAGLTKTRLIPALGPEAAADLQRRMTAHVAGQAGKLAKLRRAAVEVRFEGGTPESMRSWLGDAFHYCRQGPGDIGARMQRALAASFSSGALRSVLIGSDIPDITVDILAIAFDRLRSEDLVLGPAKDGGYYLIGLRQAAWSAAADVLFTAMPWGSSQVLAATRKKIDALGYQAALLETLADIDRPEDLLRWKQSRR